ncbi:uncharacterized protein FOMMEDRAFT_92757 [Fomitiporia mediterranea MF3/22]|uniref:uncharacterized protein n=1 Tax=Fomitiporia mediterranea (strain MF3/22) TaxID=694068 RepID=UPI000440928B|nr:uncharacterized protein FOMMEDRAFT_92757 [Fomitiporia mediterranea MF3/22]EJC99622.1 hypothetical protein FOMMEDRAFT_92757 [Fomitiporia mediterranea MF3/22]
MIIEDSHHYKLDSEIGEEEWSLMLPPNQGIIYLSRQDERFTISLFHQIRCLDNIRSALVSAAKQGARPDAVTRHCLNYIRQMILCRADLHLESMADPNGPVEWMGERTCKDWQTVYAIVAANNSHGYVFEVCPANP